MRKTELRRRARVIIGTMTTLLERWRRTNDNRLVGVAYVVALLGGSCVGLWAVGDVSDEPYDSPDGGSMLGLRLPAPLYGDGLGTDMTGLLGVVLIAAAILLTLVSRRDLGRSATYWLWPTVAWSLMIGLALGAALRVIFAITYFANMDGGLLLIFGLPILTLAWVAGWVPLSRTLRAESK